MVVNLNLKNMVKFEKLERNKKIVRSCKVAFMNKLKNLVQNVLKEYVNGNV